MMEILIDDINNYRIPSKSFKANYEKICQLGKGAFGKVYKAKEIRTGNIVAVKQIKIHHTLLNYDSIINEINVLKHLDHPNIVKYYNYFEEDDKIFIIMEYLDGGTLKEYLKNNEKNITEDNARIIIKQLLNALSYLHYSCDICHRDVKPGNIIFKYKDDINSLQLVDFGLCADTFEAKDCLDNCGTLKYMAPEQISNMIYSKGVDIWSAGIILYMLLNNGNNPFYKFGDSREEIINKITNKKIFFDENCTISEMGKNIIIKLLQKNPSYRYTARLALNHPWITMNKYDQIPLTVYDKLKIDESTEKLKLLFLNALFFLNYKKKNTLTLHSKKNDDDIIKNENKKKAINIEIPIKNIKQHHIEEYRNHLSSNVSHKKIIKKLKLIESHNYDINKYEERIIKSNKLFEQKFREYRDNLFLPKKHKENDICLDSNKKNIKIIEKTNKIINDDNENDKVNDSNINNDKMDILNSSLNERKDKYMEWMTPINPIRKSNTHFNTHSDRKKSYYANFSSFKKGINSISSLNSDESKTKYNRNSSNLYLNKTNNFNLNTNIVDKSSKYNLNLLMKTNTIKKIINKKILNHKSESKNIINNNNYLKKSISNINFSNTAITNNYFFPSSSYKNIINISKNIYNQMNNIYTKRKKYTNKKEKNKKNNAEESKRRFLNLYGARIIQEHCKNNVNNIYSYFTLKKKDNNNNNCSYISNEYKCNNDMSTQKKKSK